MAIQLNVLGMCRICLSGEDLVDVLLLGEPTSEMMIDIHRYFDVQMLFNDDKSTKICRNCISKIVAWRQDRNHAIRCQGVINYLDTKLQRQIREERERERRN